jgi:membrane protease YdiL (CAAX protease family)
MNPSKQENMRRSDWKMVSIVAIVLAVILLAGAIIAFFYPPDPLEFGSLHDYPYQIYAFPLFLAGVILLLGGILARLKLSSTDSPKH